MKSLFSSFLLSAVTVIAIAAFSGCGAINPQYSQTVTTSFLDFRPYTEAGFFISPDPYPGTYDPIGQFSIEIIPAKNASGVQMPSSKEILDIAYIEAQEKGANGISNFHMIIDEVYRNVETARVDNTKYQDSAYPKSGNNIVPVKRITLTGNFIHITK
ncbi:MAG: hypothetical protein IKW99_03740 [Bacteroidales bacterium]|nr:hypothetical protein [Bacteroidales bacterium]